MADNQPRPLRNDDDAKGIAELDDDAHQGVEIVESYERLSRLQGKIAKELDALHEHPLAVQVRHDQVESVQSAEAEGERVEGLLIEEQIRLRLHNHPEALAQLHTRFPQLRTPLSTLYDAVRANTMETDSARRAVEQTYRQLATQLAHPSPDQAAAIEFLGLLETFLKQVEQIALVNRTVRSVWVNMAEVIAATL